MKELQALLAVTDRQTIEEAIAQRVETRSECPPGSLSKRLTSEIGVLRRYLRRLP